MVTQKSALPLFQFLESITLSVVIQQEQRQKSDNAAVISNPAHFSDSMEAEMKTDQYAT